MSKGRNGMQDLAKIDLMVNVSKLYYEGYMSQSTIAEELGISKPYVSKLIKEARESGIVNIQVNDPLQSETRLERDLRSRLGLVRVVIAQNRLRDNTALSVSAAAARYINYILKNGDIVAVGAGRTMHICSQNFPERDDLENIRVVEMEGSLTNLELDVHTQDVPKSFAKALGGKAYGFPLPPIFETKEIKETVFQDRAIKKILEYQSKANVAVFSVSSSIGGVIFQDPRYGFLTQQEVELLNKRGVVGNIMGHFFSRDGQLCDKKIDERISSIPLERFKQKDYRICVGYGRNKIEAIYGALNGGYINVLVIDEDLAKGLLTLLES